MRLTPRFVSKITASGLLDVLLITSLAASLAISIFVASRQAWQQVLRPVIYLDDWPYTHRPYLFQIGELLKWITAQHAEHRKVPTRVLSILETEVFRLPILTLSGVQSLLLMLLSSGLIAWIAHLAIPRRRDAVLAWLSCSVILFNPWQFSAYNLSGLNDLFPVNASILAAALLLLGYVKHRDTRWQRACTFGMALLPWVSIYTAGQGFAMAAALVLTCTLVSRRMTVVAFLSSALAVLSFYKILPLVESAHRGHYGFDPGFLFRLLSGGSWPGLGVITGMVLVMMVLDRAVRNEQHLILHGPTAAILAMPGLFGLVYALLITLSRSGYGLDGASPSWYLVSLSLLPVSVILLASWIYATVTMQVSAANPQRPGLTSMLPHLVVVLATLFSFPQVFTGQGVPYRQALAQVSYRRFELQKSMECVASNLRKGGTAADPIESSECEIKDPAASEQYKYLSGKKPLKPSGWHLRLTKTGD